MSKKPAGAVSRGMWLRLSLLIGVLALAAAACASPDADTAPEDQPADEAPAEDEAAPEEDEGAPEEDGGATEEDTAAAPGGTIAIGWIPWDENIANTFLWKEILEQEGYEVTETQLDVAPVFDGVATGALDLFLDVWLPSTHADYWDQYGDQVEDLGTWYEGAALTIAVPDYVEAQSLADLEGMGDTFGQRIVGIEPGAGLTRITREEVMPTYGLDDWTLVESSTPAMLTELETAISSDEPVVVTLWRPHWAYAAYDIRDLEDPEGALGEAEHLQAIGREGFSDDFPDVAEWISNYEMTDDALASLSQMIVEAGTGNEQDAASQWIEQNREMVDGWLGR